MPGITDISAAKAAAGLLDAIEGATTIAAFTSLDPRFSLASAYLAQQAITRDRLAAGWRMVGRKIGFTNRSIWPLYGVDAPMWAPVFDRTVVHAAEGKKISLPLAGIVQPRIEPEILFTLAAPVPAGLTSPEQVLPYVDGYAHSIEIVQCHFPAWKARLPDFCADNACHARLIVGPVQRIVTQRAGALIDALRQCTVSLRSAGKTMLEGHGANALDHPLLTLAYLADVIASSGSTPLKAGEIISTGTLTDALPVAPGELWSTQFHGLEVKNLEIEFTH